MVCLASQGSWIVRQTVGRKACLLATGLEINYFRGKNYLEVKICAFLYKYILINVACLRPWSWFSVRMTCLAIRSYAPNLTSYRFLIQHALCPLAIVPNLRSINFQIAVHIGSSSVATGIMGLVLRYLNTLVIELAFLIQVRVSLDVSICTGCQTFLTMEEDVYYMALTRASHFLEPVSKVPLLLQICSKGHTFWCGIVSLN